MILAEMRRMLARNKVREGVLKPADAGRGWQVALEDYEGQQHPLTRHDGVARLYHSLDRATAILRELGVERICVVERF